MAYMCVKHSSWECTGCGGCLPERYICDNCCCEIEDEVYRDEKYNMLCEECLLELHKLS
jgi:hypothetical protein